MEDIIPKENIISMKPIHYEIETGYRGEALDQSDYIARRRCFGKGEKGEELLEEGCGNMPPWAGEGCREFWKASDRYERINGTTFCGYMLTLPRGLTREEMSRLAHDFIDREIGKRFAYQYAIHEKRASDGKPNPHVHIMYCRRILDGIARPKERFFRRANGEHPERGGARKDREPLLGDLHEETRARRRRWAADCNAALERAGIRNVRFFAETLEEAGFGRPPSRRLGHRAWHTPEREAELENRRENREHDELAEKAAAQEARNAKLSKILRDDDLERYAAYERELREKRRQTPEEASLDRREAELVLRENGFYHGKAVQGAKEALPSDLASIGDFVPPDKPLFQRTSTYEKRYDEALLAYCGEYWRKARGVFLWSCREFCGWMDVYAPRTATERWLAEESGENFDRRCVTEREELLAARERILDSSKLFEEGAALRGLPGMDPGMKPGERLRAKRGFAERFCRGLREAADFAADFVHEKTRNVWKEHAAQSALDREQALYLMQTGKTGPDPLFRELTEKYGSPYLARAAYFQEKEERERARREDGQERQRGRSREMAR